jgi:hypothetical protein
MARSPSSLLVFYTGLALLGLVVWKDLTAPWIYIRQPKAPGDKHDQSNGRLAGPAFSPSFGSSNSVARNGDASNDATDDRFQWINKVLELEERVSFLASRLDEQQGESSSSEGESSSSAPGQTNRSASKTPYAHSGGGPLPSCDEIMQQPHSIFRDGNFLTGPSTKIQWYPRADGSRRLDLLEICRLKRYTSEEANRCLAEQHVSMIGDSLTRYQFTSLVYFLEKGTFPARFGRPKYPPCTHVDEAGRTTCSTDGEPNICVETEWGSWRSYYTALGGGDDGGVFNGRMECTSYRPHAKEAAEPSGNMMYANGDNRAVLSYSSEAGWGETPRPLRGFFYSNCSSAGTCRRTDQDTLLIYNRSHVGDFDWSQTFPEAIYRNGTLRSVLPRPTIAIYNRGIWGRLSETRAQAIMPALYDWVGRNDEGVPAATADTREAAALTTTTTKTKGRCFFRSTTGNYRSAKNDFFKWELQKVRPIAYTAGCEYIDFAYLTEGFATLEYNDRDGTERKSVFTDSVS